MDHQSNAANFFAGLASVFVCHVVGGFLIYVLALALSFQGISNVVGTIVFVLIFGVGLSQLIYVIPLCIWLHRRRLQATMKGVIAGAVITFLLNGGCFLMLMT